VDVIVLVRVVPRAEALGCFLFARRPLGTRTRKCPNSRPSTKCLGTDAERLVPEGRPKSLSVPEIFVVETEPRHEQATARRRLMQHWGRPWSIIFWHFEC